MPPKVDVQDGGGTTPMTPDSAEGTISPTAADSPRQAAARARTYTTLGGGGSPLAGSQRRRPGFGSDSPRAGPPEPGKVIEGELSPEDLRTCCPLLERLITLTKAADGSVGFGWMGGIVGHVADGGTAEAAGLEVGSRVKRVGEKEIEMDDENGELDEAIKNAPSTFQVVVEPGELELQYNELFHHCELSGKRPADRVMLGNMKGYTERDAWEYYRQNPQHCVGVCADISDYSECFWNYRHNRWCTGDEAEHFDRVLEALFNTKSSFLDDPINTKYSEAPEPGNGLTIAATTMQGWRTDNEDAHVAQPSLAGAASYGCVAVLDGHGGRRVARFAAARVVSTVVPLLPPGAEPEALKKALYDLSLKIDETIEKEMKDEQIGTTGTTFNCVVISPKHLITANVGDSRAVLALKQGGCRPLSTDHKPGDDAEKSRIEAAGSQVTEGRVDGMLAVSRALGDFDFKQASALPPDKQAVSCAPDLTVQVRDPATDEFVLQACDGIWDCKSSEEACDFIRKQLSSGQTPVQAIEALCQDCLASELLEHGIGSDNMTVNLVVFS